MKKIDSNLLHVMDQLRSIAKEGLMYANNSYDTDRYERLLHMAQHYYSDALELNIQDVKQQFQKDFGIITPKVGADAAIINEFDEVLVLKRTDDQTWCLPCGWINVGEDPVRAAVRETYEETGLHVKPLGYISVLHKGPPEKAYLHHQITLLILMEIIQKETTIVLSSEHSDYKWITSHDSLNWHKGHDQQYQRILTYMTSEKILDI